jgi:hypothetical protein
MFSFTGSGAVEGLITVGGVEVADLSPGGLVCSDYDTYEKIKYNHGEYRDDKSGGKDIKVVDSEVVFRTAKVKLEEIPRWVHKSPHFRGVVKGLSEDEEAKFCECLLNAAVEDAGIEKFLSVQLRSPDHREVRVMLLMTQQTEDDCARFLMISHQDVAYCRQGLEWNKSWHDDPDNSRMLQNWCTFRLFQKMGKEGLGYVRSFMLQSADEDELIAAPSQYSAPKFQDAVPPPSADDLEDDAHQLENSN